MKRVSAIHLQEKYIYFFAFLASLLLSLWIDLRETVINPDGICYIISAGAVKSGLQEAMGLCGQAHWPFYSILLYAFAKLTHLSYIPAAFVLNSLFTLISVVSFGLIVQELGGTRKTLCMALFVILLAHDFNSVREYIIRDHGYWAFYLLSLLLLLKYFSKPNWVMGLAFSAAILVATLFRIEGVVFLCLLPFTAWFALAQPLSRRTISFLNLNILPLSMGVLLLGWLFWHPEALHKLGRVGDLADQIKQGLSFFTARYEASRLAFATYALTTDSAAHAGLILLLGLTGWYFVCLINSLSFGYVLLLCYAWRCKIISFKASSQAVLLSYIVINLLITISFLFQRFFLSKRYLMALSLVLMLYVPFALENLFSKWNEIRYRLIAITCVFFILLSACGGIFEFGYSKSFIHDAGDWLAENVPQKASLYSNDYQVMFYSKHFGNAVYSEHLIFRDIGFISNDKWKQYDYLAIRVGHKIESRLLAALSEIKLTPINVFRNSRDERVIIYKNTSASR